MRTRPETATRTVTRVCPECAAKFDFPHPGYCDHCGYDPQQQHVEIAADAALAQRVLDECNRVTDTVVGGRQYSLWPLRVAGSLAEEMVRCYRIPHRFQRLRQALAAEHYGVVVMSRAEAFNPHGDALIGIALEDGNYLVIL